MSSPSVSTIGERHAVTLVFVSSAAVLVLEILAGRLLAPFSGVTLETFTAIIGTILGGIALGAWMGGRMADRADPLRLLGPEMALGGLLALTMPPLTQLLGPVLGDGPVGLVLVVAVSALPAAAVLSAVTPTVVKIRLRALDETGSVVGRLSAVGTVGAIVGTFLTGFVLVARLPSASIIVAVGVILILWGAAIWWRHGGARASAGAVAAGVLLGPVALIGGVGCDVETAYYCVRVEADEGRQGGRALWLDTLRHAYVDLDEPRHLEFAYTRMMAAVIEVSTDGPLSSLHIGGGGLSMPRWLEAVRPGSTSTVLELDPALVEVAEESLGFTPGPDVEIVIGDARVGLDRVDERRYDLVVGDAFGGVAAPWHLATREVFEQIDAITDPEGVYVGNVIDRRSMSFLRAEIATLGAVFPHVIAIGHGSRQLPESSLTTGGNVVVAGSHMTFDVERIAAEAADLGLKVTVLGGDSLDAYVGDALVLTDAFAPVDQLFDAP